MKLLFQQLQILVYSCPRQAAYAGKLAGVHMPCLIRGKVLIEDRWNIVLCGGLAAYLLALGLGVGDARPHALPYEGQFQLIEYGRHLKEGGAHGVHLALPAIHSDGAKDHQPQVLLLDGFQHSAEFLD